MARQRRASWIVETPLATIVVNGARTVGASAHAARRSIARALRNKPDARELHSMISKAFLPAPGGGWQRVKVTYNGELAR